MQTHPYIDMYTRRWPTRTVPFKLSGHACCAHLRHPEIHVPVLRFQNPISEPVWQRLVAARDAKMAAELTILEEREKVKTLVATQKRLQMDDADAKVRTGKSEANRSHSSIHACCAHLSPTEIYVYL